MNVRIGLIDLETTEPIGTKYSLRLETSQLRTSTPIAYRLLALGRSHMHFFYAHENCLIYKVRYPMPIGL